MSSALWQKAPICIYLFGFILSTTPFVGGNNNIKVLNIGEELFRETLPLHSGSCLYELRGLATKTWYEVKISYPASIPATFTLLLKRGDHHVDLNRHRKLLNTEKLIFKTESLDEMRDQGGLFVLVTVEPEGVVAIPGVQEREFVIFNIVCDELLLGIPHKAWLVVALALLCLAVAFVVPLFLPVYLLGDEVNLQTANTEVDKNL